MKSIEAIDFDLNYARVRHNYPRTHPRDCYLQSVPTRSLSSSVGWPWVRVGIIIMVDVRIRVLVSKLLWLD